MKNLPEKSCKYYFAYGSNMDSNQLKGRIGSFLPSIPVYVKNYQFCYNKQGNDGSGKANIFPKDGSKTWGVIYEVDTETMKKMDKFEGVSGNHYRRQKVEVRSVDNQEYDAITYIACEIRIGKGLKPAPRYLDTIIRGARDNELPEDYIQIHLKGSYIINNRLNID